MSTPRNVRPEVPTDPALPVAPTLGLWDAVSIIVGIVVGTSIFKIPSMVFSNVPGPWEALGVWLLGGLLSLNGALCYAELATTYPRSGGDYHYLTRAFGRWMGFLFGWAQLAVILTGSIAVMSYAFADYGVRLAGAVPETSPATLWLAVGAIVVLSLLNLAGIVVGKSVQNLLSAVKVLGLVGIFLAAIVCSSRGSLAATGTWGGSSLGLALVFVLYAYGGWNDAAFVAAEVRGQQRQLPLALFLGIGLITVIYLLVIMAYLLVLGFDGARTSPTPAADVMQLVVGDGGRSLISALVMISALGAINGLILTGSRIYASLGADHAIFARLAPWNQRRGTPVAALVAQGAIAVLLVLSVGTTAGRLVIDRTWSWFGGAGLPWEKFGGGFETLVSGTAPVFWAFFLLTGLSLFVLRWRDGSRLRPFTTPLFPGPPVIFCATCLYMLYSSLTYARGLAIIGLLPLAAGIPLYAISQWLGREAHKRGQLIRLF
jgi:amino acid transporter